MNSSPIAFVINSHNSSPKAAGLLSFFTFEPTHCRRLCLGSMPKEALLRINDGAGQFRTFSYGSISQNNAAADDI